MFFNHLPLFQKHNSRRRIDDQDQRSKLQIRQFIKSTYLIRLAGMLAVVVAGLFVSTIFRVSEVRCVLEQTACPTVFTLHSDAILGKLIFTLNETDYIDRIHKSNPEVGNVWIDKMLPSVVIVRLQLRQAKYLLITPEQSLWVDKDGYVLDKKPEIPENELIPIETKESFAVGQKIVSQGIRSAIGLIESVTESGLPIKQVKVNSADDIELVLYDNLVIKGNGRKEIDKQIDSVKLILSQQSEFDGKKISEIDVRFNDPVVK